MDFNDYSTHKTIPWKPVAIATGALVLVVAAVFVTVRLVQNARAPSGVALSPTAAAEQALERACAVADDARACRQAVAGDIAKATGAASACEELDRGRERDNCVWAVARETSDAGVCAGIEDADWKTRCADGVHRNVARQTGNVAACEPILDADSRARCIESLTTPKDATSCNPEAFPDLCRDLEIQEAAIALLDVGMCRDIADEQRYDNCYELVITAVNEQGGEEEPSIEESDTDEDGLEDLMELTVYLTDPLNPDTDGDGYSDGEEVAAGYNPNGEGRLNFSQPL